MSRLYWTPGEDLAGPERWYPLPNYEGTYEISTFGRVARISAGRGVKGPLPRVLSTPPNSDGYPVIELHMNNVGLSQKLHYLVCLTFRGPKPGPDWEVDHIDGIRAHCCAFNLMWVTKHANLNKRDNGNELTDDDIAAMAEVRREEEVVT